MIAEPAVPAEVVFEADVEMRARDGVVLRANIYRPDTPGRWPTLLMRTPYGKDSRLAIHVVDPHRAASSGFLVVVQDCRGRFRSEGEWRPYEADADDGADTVAWAAALPWSNGAVGMYGSSYQGSAQLAAESVHPPALRAIAPMCCWFDQSNGQSFRGGAIELGKLARWTLMNMPERLRRVGRLDEANAGALEQDMADLAAGGFTSLPLETFGPIHRYDPDNEVFDYIRQGPGPGALPHLRRGEATVATPALWIAGWFDSFLGDALAGYRRCVEAAVPAQLVVGPWTHVDRSGTAGALDFGADAAGVGAEGLTLEEVILTWFRHWLPSPPATETVPAAAVRTFLMGANRWEEADTWPGPATIARRWYLVPNGGLGERPPSEGGAQCYCYDPADPVPTVGGATIMGGDFPAGPADQAALARRSDVLVFASEPIASPVVVRGSVSVELFVSTDAPSTDFVARLVDIDPEGRHVCLTDGIVRLPAGAPLPEPAERVGSTDPTIALCTIDLWATAYQFGVGHRIGLHVTSSSFPRWDRNLNTGEPPGTGQAMRAAAQSVWTGPEHPSCLVMEGRFE